MLSYVVTWWFFASCVKTFCLRQALVSSAGDCLITSVPPGQLAILWVLIGRVTAPTVLVEKRRRVHTHTHTCAHTRARASERARKRRVVLIAIEAEETLPTGSLGEEGDRKGGRGFFVHLCQSTSFGCLHCNPKGRRSRGAPRRAKRALTPFSLAVATRSHERENQSNSRSRVRRGA